MPTQIVLLWRPLLVLVVGFAQTGTWAQLGETFVAEGSGDYLGQSVFQWERLLARFGSSRQGAPGAGNRAWCHDRKRRRNNGEQRDS